MTRFGTSAYIKLLALNPTPRDTLIRGRITPTRSGGYDFHKAMRKIVTDAAAGVVPPDETARRRERISNDSERAYAVAALKSLTKWLDGRQIIVTSHAQIWTDPRSLFSVQFTSDFEVEHNGFRTKFHLWNTKIPECTKREAIGTLGLFVSEEVPQSIGVLSLQSEEAFVPQDAAGSRKLAMLLASDIQRRFEKHKISAESRKDTSGGVHPSVH